MSDAPGEEPEDELVAATRRLQELAEQIRRSGDEPPERVAELAEEAARLAGEVAAGIGRELRGDTAP